METVIEIIIALVLYNESSKLLRYLFRRFRPKIFWIGISFQNWRNIDYKTGHTICSGMSKTYYLGRKIKNQKPRN